MFQKILFKSCEEGKAWDRDAYPNRWGSFISNPSFASGSRTDKLFAKELKVPPWGTPICLLDHLSKTLGRRKGWDAYALLQSFPALTNTSGNSLHKRQAFTWMLLFLNALYCSTLCLLSILSVNLSNYFLCSNYFHNNNLCKVQLFEVRENPASHYSTLTYILLVK